jgi:KRAB domain-containing zinc finger protein
MCVICFRRFSDAQSMTRHGRVHTGGECRVCDKSFSQSSDLQVHMKTHLKMIAFKQLYHNMKRHNKTYLCCECGKKFISAQKLRIHTGEKLYTCGECNKEFATLTHMKRHMRTHTNEKPYGCNICDKTFSDSSNRLKHLRRHAARGYFANTYKVTLSNMRDRCDF